ncbi:MAG: CHAT domain-containing protein [Saprospiraceae bacterium]
MSFYKINEFLGILVLLIIPFLLDAQCSNKININEILQTQNAQRIQNLTDQIKDCPQLQDSLALAYHKLGIFFYLGNNLDSAIIFTNKAVKIREQLYHNEPNINLGKSYHNAGVFYSNLNQAEFAIKNLKQAINIYQSLDSIRMLDSYVELVIIHINVGDYQNALDYCELVISEAQKIGEVETEVRGLLEYGRILLAQREYRKAIGYFERTIPIYQKIEDFENQAISYSNLGVAYYELNNYTNAIQNYLKTIEIYRIFEMTEELAIAQNNLGIIYQKNNQERQSFRILKDALKNAQKVNSNGIITQSYNNIGEHFFAKKDYHTALSYFQKSIKTLLPRFQRNEDWHNPTKMDVGLAFNKIDLLTCFGDKAKTLRFLSQTENDPKYLTSALELYELGDLVIDQLRKEHQDQDTKLFWRKEAIPFYENAIEVCYEIQNVEKAFFFFEKSKAILLLEALQTSDALALVPDSLKNHIQTLQQELLKYKEALDQEDYSRLSKEGIIKELVGLQHRFEIETENLAKDYPKFFEVKFGTKVISLSDAQEEFSNAKERTAIHFFYGEKNIYALTIRFSKAELYQLGSTDSIEKEIRSLLSYFEKSSNIENAPKEFLKQSKMVFDILIAPLSFEKEGDVIIFPDGALAYLPFESLVGSISGDIASADYMIKYRKIHYGYSATIFSKLNRKVNQSTENRVAAFAPFANESVNSKYATLAFSQDELGEISQQIQGVFLKNQKATKKYFLENSNEFSVLHLSTHAFSSATETKPHIVFADTSLFLSELYGLEIPADLVVLSACQSNIGKLSPGEGVMSLGRGFTFAGSKSLVSSLWNVNAVSTSSILSDFYKNLQNGNSKYESLHAAKLAYLKNENIPSYERSPYYWAGLIYYGDDGGVVLIKKTNNKFYGFLAFGAVCFLIGFYFSKRKMAT